MVKFSWAWFWKSVAATVVFAAVYGIVISGVFWLFGVM